MEEDDFINLQLKAEVDTETRESGREGHLPLGDAPISNRAA